jgi:hypothetical protein
MLLTSQVRSSDKSFNDNNESPDHVGAFLLDDFIGGIDNLILNTGRLHWFEYLSIPHETHVICGTCFRRY